MEEDIYKVGDKVFDIFLGWGKIENIINYEVYPLKVTYSNIIGHSSYTKKGKMNITDTKPRLSFTEYDLVNGGFSQERPVPNIKKDTLIYVSDGKVWHMRYFSHFKDGKIYVFMDQNKSNNRVNSLTWKEWSLTNPLEKI